MVTAKKKTELIEQLGAICEELGWVIAVPSLEGEESPGLIIGEEEFVLMVVNEAFGENVDLYTKEMIDDEITDFTPAIPAKKGNTFH